MGWTIYRRMITRAGPVAALVGALVMSPVTASADETARDRALDFQAEALYRVLSIPVETLAEMAPAAGPKKQDPAAADSIAKLAGDALAIMNDPTATASQKEASFREILARELHTELLSRVVLGKYWRKADSATRAEFTEAFSTHMVHSFAKKLGAAQLEKFQVVSAFRSGKSDSLVQSRVVHAGNMLNVVWRVRPIAGRYVILDVMIEGVSMALTRRQEFAAFIQSKGGDIHPLIAQLQQKSG